MSRIILLLIPLIALVSGQSNNVTTEPPSNTTTIATTIVTNATTEPITNTTTLAPTTTVAPTTTPTPSPTIPPAQAPDKWNGNVTKGDNSCINVGFKVQISVKYNMTTNSTGTTKFNIPANAKVNEDKSYCSSNLTQLEAIVIDFVDEFTSGILTLTFNKTNTNDSFVQKIELSYNLTKTQFPFYIDPKQYNQMVTVSQTNLTLFKVMKQRSYTCSDAQSAVLTREKKDLQNEAHIEFTDSQVEAYIDQKRGGNFDTALDCATTNVSDVVPIAVGAALAGLVVIVLIAYFIGRRRSRRLAYQSV